MDEQEVKGLILKELVSFEEDFVSEKVYWQRTVRMIIVLVSMLLGLFGGMIGWGFNWSTEVTNNTQWRRDADRRMETIEHEQNLIIQNYKEVGENQKEVLSQTTKVSRKLDALIDKAGARYRE